MSMLCAPRLDVLRHGPAGQRTLYTPIIGLLSFALAHGIESQNHETL